MVLSYPPTMPTQDTKFKVRCVDKILNLDQPQVMGILNITPDSFSDGGAFSNFNAALDHAEKMILAGAKIIDVGGYSTRPQAEWVEEKAEAERVIPLITQLCKIYPDLIVSVDTFRSSIALKAFNAGATIVNDISGGAFDPELHHVVASNQMAYVLMHHRYDPARGHLPPLEQPIGHEVTAYFQAKLNDLKHLGIENIILDPGFGFGKTLAQNYELLHHLKSFSKLQLPLLSGISRKSMLYKILKNDAQHADNATTVANTLALLGGASLLRVHNVQNAIEAIGIFNAYQKYVPQLLAEN